MSLDAASRRSMASALQQRQGAGWRITSALPNASIEENQYVYLRQNSFSTKSVLGDLRVSFSVTPSYPVTVCAMQVKGSKLAPFTASNGEKVFLLEDGVLGPNELFDRKLSAKVGGTSLLGICRWWRCQSSLTNGNFTVAVQSRENWFFRLFSSVLGFIGFLVLRPLIVARYGHFVADIQQHLLASSLSVGLTSVVVGLSWVLYRCVDPIELQVPRRCLMRPSRISVGRCGPSVRPPSAARLRSPASRGTASRRQLPEVAIPRGTSLFSANQIVTFQ